MKALSKFGICVTFKRRGRLFPSFGIVVSDQLYSRSSSPTPTPIASFHWHKAPITSIEWHPSDPSTFAASSADNIVSLWDLAVEQDDDEMNDMSDTKDVPPQMLFNHHQKDVKEVHWHPQIPGAVISTGADGFDVFSTIAT